MGSAVIMSPARHVFSVLQQNAALCRPHESQAWHRTALVAGVGAECCHSFWGILTSILQAMLSLSPAIATGSVAESNLSLAAPKTWVLDHSQRDMQQEKETNPCGVPPGYEDCVLLQHNLACPD